MKKLYRHEIKRLLERKTECFQIQKIRTMVLVVFSCSLVSSVHSFWIVKINNFLFRYPNIFTYRS